MLSWTIRISSSPALSVTVKPRPDPLQRVFFPSPCSPQRPTKISSAWHGYKYIDPKESGAVIPIVHVNGFKISERTIYGTMDDLELTALFRLVNLNHYSFYVYLRVPYPMSLHHPARWHRPYIFLRIATLISFTECSPARTDADPRISL